MKHKFVHRLGLSTAMKKRRENEKEFPVENFGARKVKEERELSAGKKQPLLLEMMRGGDENDDELCVSNRMYRGRCIPE